MQANSSAALLGVDGKPKNKRFQQNIFEEEVVLTEKQRMRNDLVENKDGMKEAIKNMSPVELFVLFDEDDSGLISFDEFKKMLPFLDINISNAKAYRYFKLCDTDGSGEIDIEEFQVALFACDPNSGNPVGYQPSKYLTPLDAFEVFDEDQSGFLDEDEFRYAMEYLNIKIIDEELENAFLKYDINNNGSIDYEEFRECFLHLCDLRKELEDREVEVPTLIRNKTLRKMLRELLMEEELKERKALAEARRYKKWLLNIRDSKRILKRAEFRAYQELRNALDATGQVYVIGKGNLGQFAHPPPEKLHSSHYKFEYFDRVMEIWKDRVRPEQLVDRLKVQRRAEEHEEERDADRVLTGLGAIAKEMDRAHKIDIDPYKEALNSAFRDIEVGLNTVCLWGRRIHQVAVSESVLFALADTGEVFTLGGNSFWWNEIQPESVYQTKWRGDTTPRSQLLLNTTTKTLPPDASLLEDGSELLTADDKFAEMVRVVAKYYNVWEPPPNPAQKMRYLKRDMMSVLSYEGLKLSLKIRGKVVGDKTKLELVEALYSDIMLEKRLLGERTHKAIREIETQVTGLLKRKKKKMADKFMKRIEEMWLPLREMQAEHQAAEIAKDLSMSHQLVNKQEESYQSWRRRMNEKREDMFGEVTPRGNSLKIDLVGLTPRGPEMITPRGYQCTVQISAGASHTCIIHKSGQLYSWGVGASGRLGLDLTEGGNPQQDVSRPTLVQTLSEKPVIRVSCGFSHTGAVVAGGDLFMWGSAVGGKCGLGPVVNTEECYCSMPTRVILGPEDRRVKKVSCGSAHTAAVTDAGQLYVFGCGDGGRLGLGRGVHATIYKPTLVESLLHTRIASISCGNTTTIVAAEIRHEWIGDIEDQYRQLTGGEVYVAGSVNVLGRQCDEFSLVHELSNTPVKSVSAGFLHTIVVSAEGELFSWGHNTGGCCGAPITQHFVGSPLSAKFLHCLPTNLAKRKTAYQSSTYNGREAVFAVDGKKDGFGVHKATCTQQEGQAWLEIDLGKIVLIESIKVWNRTDTPTDRSQPRDLYTARLFPCWVMIGREPFSKSAHAQALKESLLQATCKVKFTENKRVSAWTCPANAQGRYVRVQLERYSMLSIAEVEVFGYGNLTRGVGRVSHATAGREVTVAVIRPSTDPRDIETSYKRAAYSDSCNADILKQFESYALEYDKFGRGEVLANHCVICKGSVRCESCVMYDAFAKDIANMPPAIGGRRRRLNSIAEFLINSNKPPLDPIVVPKSLRPTKWEVFRQTYLEQFSLFNLFATRARKAYVTPQEAIQTNPHDMMERLQHLETLKRANTGERTDLDPASVPKRRMMGGGTQSSSVASESNQTKLSLSGSDNYHNDPQHTEGEETATQSTKSHNDKRMKDKKAPFEVGDVLPTGHVVKGVYPKSVTDQLDDEASISSEKRIEIRSKIKKSKEKEERLKKIKKAW